MKPSEEEDGFAVAAALPVRTRFLLVTEEALVGTSGV